MSLTDRLQCAVPSAWTNDFSQCLYEWQSLEAGGVALIAAILSVWWIRRQIQQEKDHHADEIQRRHNAARLTLPLALAAVHELIAQSAGEIAARLEAIYDRERGKEKDSWIDEVFAAVPFPKISADSEVLRSFRDFVETLRRPEDIRHIAELVSSLQVYLARYNDFDPAQVAQALTLNSLMLDAAKIQLLVDKVYNYARFVDDSSFGIVKKSNFEAAWDEIHGKAQSLVFFRQRPDDFFPAFRESVDRHKANHVSPWNEKFS